MGVAIPFDLLCAASRHRAPQSEILATEQEAFLGERAMIRSTLRWGFIILMAGSVSACGLARIPIQAPTEPIRIEVTLVLKHEYVLPN